MAENESNAVDYSQVKSVSLFRSVWETGRKLTDAQRHRLYDAIGNFAFMGETPTFDDDLLLDLCWTNIEPNITASVRRSLDGSRGGRGNKKASAKKGALKGTSKDTDKASIKTGLKSENPTPTPTPTPTPFDSTPIHSYPASSSIEEGAYEVPFIDEYDDMSLASEDIAF